MFTTLPKSQEKKLNVFITKWAIKVKGSQLPQNVSDSLVIHTSANLGETFHPGGNCAPKPNAGKSLSLKKQLKNNLK